MSAVPSRKSFRAYLYSAVAIFCALALLAPFAEAIAAPPGNTLPLYMVHHFDNNIDTLDPLTGQALTTVPITLGGVGVTGGFWGLDQQPTTGTLFAIWKRTELVTINPVTGAMVDIGPTGHNVGAITFATVASVVKLYMVSGNSDSTNPDTLFTLNTTTGAATLVLAFGNGNQGETLTFNPIDGLLYRAYGSGDVNVDQFLNSINPTTLAVTNIPYTGDSFSQATSLTHWAGNFFLMADHGNSSLYLVTSTGQVTVVTSLFGGNGDTKGLVFTGAPAPCTPVAALYGTANSTSFKESFLYSINPATAATSLIGPIGFGEVAIQFNAAGTLFGTGHLASTASDAVSLLTINPCTGLGTLVGGTTGLETIGAGFEQVADISLRKSDGALFATLLGEGGNGLATFNTTTGVPTAVATIGGGSSGAGLAFSPSGTLFYAPAPALDTVNTTTGVPTVIANVTYPLLFTPNSSSITGMDFQPNAGPLFGVVSTTIAAGDAEPGAPVRDGAPPTVPANFLVTINTTTAAASLVGGTEIGMHSIAFSPAAALPPASITATGGTPQTTRVGTNFGLPLQATVKDSTSTPVAGVTVTFTAPGSGASAIFAGGVNTAVTNASGVATSVVISANATVGGPYTVAATVAGVTTPANFALTNTVGPPAQIAITSGTPQTATVTTAFALPLVVTVKDSNGNVTPGVTVTFTAPAQSGASGTFAGGTNTAVTNASGVATSGTFTANGISGGPYNVTASLPPTGSAEFMAATALPEGFATSATFSLKNVDFSVTPTTTTQTVKAGATANYSLNFTAIVGNSTSATTFTCTGLPALSACVFTPASLPANSPNTPFTLAISTTAAGTHLTTVGPANKFVGPFTKALPSAALVLVALMLSMIAIPKRRFARLRTSAIGVFGFAALLLLTSYISGCGGAGSGFPAVNNSPGTPAGTSTVTIVGTSGSVQRTTTVTLIVQ